MLALAQILRNESFMLDNQLAALKPHFPLMVALDFGSTDGTQDILNKHGVNWESATWPNSYAEARNMVLDKAWGLGADSVFFLDGDEMIFQNDAEIKLLNFFAVSYAFYVTPYESGMFPRINLCRGRRWQKWSWPDYQPRLITKASGIRYCGAVHETLSKRNTLVPLTPSIFHYTQFKSPEFQHLKCQNYERLAKGEPTDWTLPVPEHPEIPQQGEPYEGPLPFEELFTQDWFTPHTERMEPFLRPFMDKPCAILEVGCYEGRSTCWFLENFPLAAVDTMDTFEGGAEHKELDVNFHGVKERFWFNVDRWRDRVRLFHGESRDWFADIQNFAKGYDIAFVDGSHEAVHVLADVNSSFNRLKSGGILVADDYAWDRYEVQHRNPRMGIDIFLESRAKEMEVLSLDYRAIIRKR